MLDNNSTLHHPFALFDRLAQDWMRFWRTLYMAAATVYTRPIYVLIALLAVVGSVGLTLWLSNIEILRLVFASTELDGGQKLKFLIEMYPIALRVTGGLQLMLITAYGIGIGFVCGLWFYEAGHMKGLPHEKATPGLVLGVIGWAISTLGIILILPVLAGGGLIASAEGSILGTSLAFLGLMICLRACGPLSRAVIGRNS